MSENLTDEEVKGLHNVAWKCRECGEVTYHPSADRKAKIEIRTGTLCLKCMREWRDNGARKS
ncbi:hypothetical protein ES703_80661 [subsurface metagenome]